MEICYHLEPFGGGVGAGGVGWAWGGGSELSEEI